MVAPGRFPWGWKERRSRKGGRWGVLWLSLYGGAKEDGTRAAFVIGNGRR